MVAIAYIFGSSLYPSIVGTVIFKDVPLGSEVHVSINGLPDYQPGTGEKPPIGPHGFHIHNKGSCKGGNQDQPFMKAGGHYNIANQLHGNHAGDLPVIFSNNGYCRMAFFTNKFKVKDIIDKSVIIHENPDDYRTQPSGNSGKRIACGVINKLMMT